MCRNYPSKKSIVFCSASASWPSSSPCPSIKARTNLRSSSGITSGRARTFVSVCWNSTFGATCVGLWIVMCRSTPEVTIWGRWGWKTQLFTIDLCPGELFTTRTLDDGGLGAYPEVGILAHLDRPECTGHPAFRECVLYWVVNIGWKDNCSNCGADLLYEVILQSSIR